MPCQASIVDMLRSRGVRITPQREIILEALCHQSRHMTADEVFAKVHPRLPGLNIATVYRTLEMLRRARVITATQTPDGAAEYEVLRQGGDHHHLVCETCGDVVDADHELFVGLRQTLEERYGFAANFEHLTFQGRCAKCRQGA